MKASRGKRGFTVLEMVWALAVIAALGAIYFFYLESYKERRTGEQAPKVLMLAARAEEEYFAKELQYFDAEVSGNGSDTYLKYPDGKSSSVRVPEKIVLSLKAHDPSSRTFTGHAFYTGGDVLHKYDSDSGKIVTVSRIQEKTE